MDRVTNIAWKTASGATLGGVEYEYDAIGRITARSLGVGTNSFDRVYAYDDLDRLASDGDVTYTYDAAGNRMTRTEDGATVTYTLGVGDRLASWTGGAYTHDAAGNVTRIEREGRPTLFLTWNSRYQLDTVYTNGVFAEGYVYDALGRRVATANMEGTTRHVYDDNWQVVADVDTNARSECRRCVVLSADRHPRHGLGLRRLAEQRRRPLAVRRLGQCRRRICRAIVRCARNSPLPFPVPRVVCRDWAHPLPHALVRRRDGALALQGSDRSLRR